MKRWVPGSAERMDCAVRSCDMMKRKAVLEECSGVVGGTTRLSLKKRNELAQQLA